jgi:hypothetical protein
MLRPLLHRLVLPSLLFLAGCGGSDGATGATGANGTLVIQLRGGAEAEAALVTFADIRVGSENGQFVPLSLVEGAPRMCDLCQLTGSAAPLSSTSVPAGHYGQIRVVLSDASLHFQNRAASPACAPHIAPPRGRQGTVTIAPGDVRIAAQFDVASGATTTVTLEFDGERSFIPTAQGYELRAVIRVAGVDGP